MMFEENIIYIFSNRFFRSRSMIGISQKVMFMSNSKNDDRKFDY